MPPRARLERAVLARAVEGARLADAHVAELERVAGREAASPAASGGGGSRSAVGRCCHRLDGRADAVVGASSAAASGGSTHGSG